MSNPEEPPVACTLGPDDGAARVRRWQALADAAHPQASRVGPVLRITARPESPDDIAPIAAMFGLP